jgi:hypothetical protein
MANVFSVNVYQINQKVLDRDAPQRIAFPSTGVLLKDVSASPARSLSSGYNVYSLIQIANSNGFTPDLFYCAETISQLVTIVG